MALAWAFWLTNLALHTIDLENPPACRPAVGPPCESPRFSGLASARTSPLVLIPLGSRPANTVPYPGTNVPPHFAFPPPLGGGREQVILFAYNISLRAHGEA